MIELQLPLGFNLDNVILWSCYLPLLSGAQNDKPLSNFDAILLQRMPNILCCQKSSAGCLSDDCSYVRV